MPHLWIFPCGISVCPSSSWRPTCIRLKLMFSEPSPSILKTLSSSEWRGLDFIHYYVWKPIASSDFLSLDSPPAPTLPNSLNNVGLRFWFSS